MRQRSSVPLESANLPQQVATKNLGFENGDAEMMEMIRRIIWLFKRMQPYCT